VSLSLVAYMQSNATQKCSSVVLNNLTALDQYFLPQNRTEQSHRQALLLDGLKISELADAISYLHSQSLK
jgi:hypothetical protein